jgi:hypothetical protein
MQKTASSKYKRNINCGGVFNLSRQITIEKRKKWRTTAKNMKRSIIGV